MYGKSRRKCKVDGESGESVKWMERVEENVKWMESVGESGKWTEEWERV